MHPYLRRTIALLIWAVAVPLSFQTAHAQGADCRAVETDVIGNGLSKTVLDQAWSGTRIRFDAIASGDQVLVGYFDADRWLTVAEFDRRASRACYVRLDSQFGGWDSHNSITLALDHDGRLHVAGNMHAAPLVYARSDKKGSLDGLRRYQMLGKDETKVTYPRFLTIGNDLLFLYREGGSGNGKWFANRWNGKDWQRQTPGALFTDTWKGETVSAYPSDFIQGSDGTYHVAVVWRRKPDASKNFVVSYMKTPDFVNWTTVDNRPLGLPLAPTSDSTVEAPGENSGLLNSPQISLDTNGRPAIVYTRYNDAGKNAAFVAMPNTGGSQSGSWKIVEIAAADQRTIIEGRGTLPNTPRLGPMNFDPHSGKAWVNVGFPGAPTQRYVLASDTMKVLSVRPPPAALAEAKIQLPQPEGIAAPVDMEIPVVAWPNQSGADRKSVLRYTTQRPNNDLARKCVIEAPRACDPPPSDLTLIERRDAVQ